MFHKGALAQFSVYGKQNRLCVKTNEQAPKFETRYRILSGY